MATVTSCSSILIVPGLDNSGPEHWQTHWEHCLDGARRAELGRWHAPDRLGWRAALAHELEANAGPTIIVAHSLGCLATVDWALHAKPKQVAQIAGTLLVAPPDVERPGGDPRLKPFAPWPRGTLPFPAILVASRDDPYASFDASRDFAASWGAELIDCGLAGHINAGSRLGAWAEGQRLLSRL